MEFIRKIWEILNGRKAMIGGVCLWIGLSLIEGLMIGTLEISWVILPKIAAAFIWVGQYLAPLGLVHKAAKALGTK